MTINASKRASARTKTTIIALVLFCRLGWALNPSLDINQYAHKSWTIREGFFKGAITSIAQMPDGYLWLGTEFGLVRFDGVRSSPWTPPPDQHLPSNNVRQLLVAQDGRLWIGTLAGVASWKDGRLTHYPELAGQIVNTLLEDRHGTIWAGALGAPTGRLCSIQKTTTKCYGEDGSLGVGVLSLYEYKGNLWVGAATGLWQWEPDPPKVYSMPGPIPEISALIEGDNGALWIALRDGIRQLVDGNVQAYPMPAGTRFTPYRLLRDHDGGLWIGSSSQGLLHLHQGIADQFASADGLSGEQINSLFEDREGNIWVATNDGLDCFRNFVVPTISIKQGLSNPSIGSVLAARDGSIWAGTVGLNRWKDGQITIYRKRSDRSQTGPAYPRAVREINDDGLPDDLLESIFQDDRGRIWVSTPGGLAYLEAGRFIPVGSVPSQMVHSFAEESPGSLWVNDQGYGLFHLLDLRLVERIPWAKLGHKDSASALVGDRVQGGLWLGFFNGGVAYVKDGQVRASYAPADGLGEGRVAGFQLDRDGTLWAATHGGLSRVKDGHVTTLTNRNGLPCDAVHWMVEDDAHSFWLYMECGLARIARPELDAWVNDRSHVTKITFFDSSDGVRSQWSAGGYSPSVTKSADGKLWFVTRGGISVVDPRHLPFNKLAPPVHIENIKADGKVYDLSNAMRLPALTRDVSIDYTALTFVAPEKVHFRYKLEGQDPDWKEVVNIRQAQYSNLAPRKYRFHVIACNNSGVWNETGDSFEFSVAPAYYQTAWFGFLCTAAFIGLLWAAYRYRVHQVAREFDVRLEERVNERTRIARELHDTLLQSFHGLLLRFQAVDNMMPPGRAKETLEQAIDRASQAITEGRDAVQQMRSSTAVTNDLALAIRSLGEGLAADSPTSAQVKVEGVPRELQPILRDEIYKIAGEALRNAFRHAQAAHVEVEIHYDDREMRLVITDDGKGIDPTVLKEGREGHFGLPGMRERATLMGGTLDVWSRVGEGTEVELTVSAAAAYESPRRRLFLKRQDHE